MGSGGGHDWVAICPNWRGLMEMSCVHHGNPLPTVKLWFLTEGK